MRWTVHGHRTAYTSPWVNVELHDIELPDHRRIEHHVLAMPKPSVGAVVVEGDHTLLIWRHRFITDAWGWEIPAGWGEPGEDLVAGVRREIAEETGYSVGRVDPLIEYNPLSGLSSMRYHGFVATETTRTSHQQADTNEVTKAEWFPLDALPGMAARGDQRRTVAAAALLLPRHVPTALTSKPAPPSDNATILSGCTWTPGEDCLRVYGPYSRCS